MSIHVEIDTTNEDLVNEFGQPGKLLPAPSSVQLVCKDVAYYRALDIPTTINLLLERIDEVAISLFASWLYDKLKDRAQRLRVNGEEIQLTPEAVKRIFEKSYNK